MMSLTTDIYNILKLNDRLRPRESLCLYFIQNIEAFIEIYAVQSKKQTQLKKINQGLIKKLGVYVLCYVSFSEFVPRLALGNIFCEPLSDVMKIDLKQMSVNNEAEANL